MEGAGVIDSRKKLLLDHRKEIIKLIDSLNENLKLIDSKIEIYNSPNAVEIINAQIKKAIDDKRENCLLNHYTQLMNSEK
jgi:tmRNA-binding protein